MPRGPNGQERPGTPAEPTPGFPDWLTGDVDSHDRGADVQAREGWIGQEAISVDGE